MSTDLLTAARRYAAKGWPVFPCEPRGKRPLTPNGFSNATTDDAQIVAWWTQWPDANVGFVPGRAGLICFDLDGPEGEAAAQRFGLCAEPTLTVTTGRGRHLYFQRPAFHVGNRPLAPHLDVRCDDGYTLLPPSVHGTGAVYTRAGTVQDLKALPPTLDVLSQGNGRPHAAPLPEQIFEGERNATLTSIAGTMRRRGASEQAILAALHEENATRCEPPLDEDELATIAHSVARYAPVARAVRSAGQVSEQSATRTDPPKSERPVVERSTLTHIRDLLAEPDDPLEWIVDGLLPAGGMSVIGGKPKSGKSTLARAIALRVCRGEPVLERATSPGPVVYLGLEDPRRVTKAHFRALGATPDDELFVWTGQRPVEAMLWLEREVLSRVEPVLCVVDTLQQLLGISDLNDYSKVVAALSPVLALVRSRRAHLVFTHHAGKGDRQGFDAILGSVGIVGTVDVSLLVRRREGVRTLTTEQRIDANLDLPETVLTLDEHREPRLGPSKQDYEVVEAEKRVKGWLERRCEQTTRAEIEDGVEGNTALTRKALYRLVEAGDVSRTGAGKKGEPFLFSCFPPIEKTRNQETENRGESSYDGANACFRNLDDSAAPPKTQNQETDPETALKLALAALDPAGWDPGNPEGATLLARLASEEPL